MGRPAHPPAGTPGAGARRARRRARSRRGDRPPGRDRRGPRPADRRGGEGARRGAGRGRSARGADLLPEGLHPGHPAVPGQVPLLHVRGDARSRRRGTGRAPYLSPDEILDDRPRGRGAGLPGGAVHAGRPARGPVARGPRVARRAGLRLDARLRAGDGGPGAGGDRAAAPPQPRRDVVGGAEPAQAGLAVDGDDARDHLPAAVRDQGRGALRLPGQGPRGPAAGARGRRPALDPVHDRPAGRHRRDARPSGRRRSSRCAVRRAPSAPSRR